MKILVIGDSCQDVYQLGHVDRISPEAPVPVFVPTTTHQNPGMASNVYANVCALGVAADFKGRSVGIKTRLVDERSRQQLIRIDSDLTDIEPLTESDLQDLDYDAMLVSDYGKGTVSYGLLRHLHECCRAPVFVDTKKTELAQFPDFWFKINALEAARLTNSNLKTVITKGRDGVEYAGRTYAVPSIAVTDVCGAGDTFLAALAIEYLRNHDIHDAIEYAIAASSVTVQHWGVYAPTREEIDEARRKST